MEWYTIQNIATIDTPALVVYPQRVLQNIRAAISMTDDISLLRPHVKTHKMAAVCRLMLQEGITKFKCATIAEAEMLGQEGAPDILLAYQPVGPKMQRFFQLVQTFRNSRFACLVDNAATAAALSDVFSKQQQVAAVYIDLNTGMNRTGIKPQHAFMLFEAMQLLPGLQVAGLHAYDGNIRNPDFEARESAVQSAFEPVLVLAAAINAYATAPVKIVAGGTPTFNIHCHTPGVECSPGTFVFSDWGYRSLFPEQPFEWAALVVTRVVSITDAQHICTDLGHKSVAAENALPRVHFISHPAAVPIGQSEEHLVLEVPDSSRFSIGDVLYGVPVHICPTVALYESAVVVEDHQATTSWAVTARNKKITI